ncbi:MAG: hypothetical protein J7K83_04290, partial [Candidatus Aenigmarchaeota archaeon]|nr:hypothetical protein [Candidatus Aenigmarchaeota archaeon]
GISVSGTAGEGWSPTVSVVFGSTSGTAAEGNKQITVSAGSGLAGGGTVTIGAGGSVTLSHADTSSQSSVDNSGGTVIQDITLDGYGHVTGLTSVNLDNRYYTESEADTRFVNAAGDSMSGDLTMSDNDILDANTVQANTLEDPEDGQLTINDGVYISGNVGIGVTSPSEKLDVNGGIKVNYLTDGTSRSTSFWGSSADIAVNSVIYTAGILHQGETGGSPAGITFGDGNTEGNDQISLITNGETRLYINSGGNVGIGTTSPAKKLDVNGEALIRSKLYFDSGGNSQIYWDSANNRLVIQVA